jgi:16S rRNA processing protein RimM
MRVDIGGEPLGELEIESARPYHREWLIKFRGIADRPTLDSFRGAFLAADAGILTEPEGDEVYLHELDGFSVRDEAGNPLGLVTNLFELASGLMLEVQGPKREFLLPYKKEFVVGVERGERRLVVRVPDGLLD